MENDPKYLLVWAESKSPQEWEEIIRDLGAKGFSMLDPLAEGYADLGTPELDAYQGAMVDRDDFLIAADEHNITHQTAGRAWSLVTRLFMYKTFSEHYSRYRWNRNFEFEDTPIVFINTPDRDRLRGDLNGYERQLGGLAVESLEELLKQLENAIKSEGKSAIHRLLGPEVGPKTINCLYAVVEGAKTN
jgi:hypothetical protein